jgi:hypothetical protein
MGDVTLFGEVLLKRLYQVLVQNEAFGDKRVDLFVLYFP